MSYPELQAKAVELANEVTRLEAEVERLRSLPDNPVAVDVAKDAWKDAQDEIGSIDFDEGIRVALRAAVRAVGGEGK